MKIKRFLWMLLGCAGLALGAVGAVLPLLPAFPFLLLAAVGFGKSSERLHRWFTGTKLYKDNLESYVKGQGMTRKTKIRVMVTVTLLMAVGLFIMFSKALYIPCAKMCIRDRDPAPRAHLCGRRGAVISHLYPAEGRGPVKKPVPALFFCAFRRGFSAKIQNSVDNRSKRRYTFSCKVSGV